MRIRIAVHRFRPEVGGTELMAEMMATAMVRRGHDVEIVTLRTRGGPSDERSPIAPGGATYRVRRLEYLDGPFRIPVGYWRVLAEPTDVLHVFGNRIWNSDFFLPIAGRLRYPTVLTGQNFYQLYMHPSAVNRLYAERYFPWAARNVSCYVVQTVGEGEQFRRFGYRGEMERIPHTVDDAEFPLDAERGAAFRRAHLPPGRLLLLTSGGFAPNKRIDRVIRGLARARSRWHLIVAGADWPGQAYDYAHCRAIAEETGASVEFLGEGRASPRDEIVSAFLACDAYGQGSSYEGYGGAVQEAMTVQKPFIAYPTGAIGEFEAAGAGYSVTSDEAFGQCLDALAAAPDLRDRLGRAGRQEVLAHRCLRVTMDQYERLFERLASGRRPPAR